ncbi:formyltransferase family protein [Kitasatospora kifunensis]|uniref:phosphoribosylglycinamide formyltransferase 1 n=1 Tax=Kitasatospora kifunensis TaxID=58351 RepID=A0A7W7QXB7_KITKI|nr:formyltransferase family protein [Kitasatospora kifunensis]MBB4921497.1 methionyl-tRNA formyltransferase [Kitasatospora kifunensis]
MIFVGRGALLKRAATHALTAGHRVDLVVSNDPADAAGGELPYLITTDVNAQAEQLIARCTDGVVWSINNWMIFRAPLLDSGLRIYNIHNGLLPQHRGLPSAAIAYALLHGHTQYGATLHEVDVGVDTGRVLAEQPFPIAPDARHHQVLLRGIQACHQLFQRTLPAVAAGHPPEPPLPREPLPGAYYGHRSLRALTSYADHPAYGRATDLGVAAPFVPELVEALGAAVDV